MRSAITRATATTTRCGSFRSCAPTARASRTPTTSAATSCSAKDPALRCARCTTRRIGESVRFDRDGEGRIVAVGRDAIHTRVRRDALGSIEALQCGDLVLGIGHDSEGRLTAVHRDGALLVAIQRDPRGLVAAYTHGED